MLRLFSLLLIIIVPVNLVAQINVVPLPTYYENKEGQFILNKNTSVILQGSHSQNINSFLSEYLLKNYQVTLVSKNKAAHSKKIVLRKRPESDKLPGAYTLQISPIQVLIESANDEGLFYGVQTFLQLMPSEKSNVSKEIKINCILIKDKPAFPYRGMQLDVARHFFPVSYIKKYIDYLSYHKFNYFHIHLTDDQGWRIQIKKYPLLTTIGSCRDQTLIGRFGSDQYDGVKYCGFYSQEDIKEIVKYAADRFITVIPEIDVPGHSLAALAAYPFLGCTKGPYRVRDTWGVQPDVFCAGNDSTYQFIEEVLDEVIALFPASYIHIGGDECPKERWKKCPVCQQKIKDLNLKDEHQLQSYFIQRIEKYLNNKERKIIGWDEILEGGIAPNATVMSWRGIKGGISAAKQSHFVIMTPEKPLYLNHTQTKNEDSVTQGGFNSLEDVYNYYPVPDELNGVEAGFIKGIEGEVWTEYISNPSKLEYMLFPRLSAVAEIAWNSKKNWLSFENRLPALMDRYKFWNLNFSSAYYDLQPSVLPGNNNSITWQLLTKSKEKIVYTKDETQHATFIYAAPVLINSSGMWSAILTDKENRLKGNWVRQQFLVNKASGKKIYITFPPNSQYGGQGGFTLVDGVQNTLGMLKGFQFLGFINSDLEALIDLGTVQNLVQIKLHAFEQQPSWIYAPLSVSFEYSLDGVNFNKLPLPVRNGIKNIIYSYNATFTAQYIRIKAINPGIIKEGLPGAGSKAWIFFDEIEVN